MMSGFEFVTLCLALFVGSSSAQSYGYGSYYGATTAYGYGGYPAGYYAPPTSGTYPLPTYYYVSPPPVSPGYYSPPTAPVYYYVTPTAPSTPGYYSPPSVATYYYYYASPSPSPVPSPIAISPSPPTSPVPPLAPSVPSPAACPVCATCEAPAPTARRLLSEGQCYCPYDSEWKSWAVADPHCRATLYSKCQSDSRLECDWLDAYFSSAERTSKDFTRAHESEIYNFLYNDCPPAKPCSCSALTFTSKDAAADVYRCCSDLQVHAKVPFSGLTQRTVDAFCSGNSVSESKKVKSWVQHSLWHANCPATSDVESSSKAYIFHATDEQAEPEISEEVAKAKTVTLITAPFALRNFGTDIDRMPPLPHMPGAMVMAGVIGALSGAAMAIVVMLVVMRINAPHGYDRYNSMV